MKAAEELFYEERTFKLIVYCGLGILAFLSIAGLIYEFGVKKYLLAKQTANENSYHNVEMANRPNSEEPSREGEFDELLQDYKSFHDSWVERCKKLQGKPLHGC